MAWYDRKENSTGALCARLSGDASKVGTFNNFFTNLKISLTVAGVQILIDVEKYFS